MTEGRFERIRTDRWFPTRLGFALLLAPWFVLHAPADTHYVSPSGSHVTPFTNWPTAATNIQAAVDVAADGDTVLVTNGVYDTGGVVIHGSMTNRIAVTNAVTVRSVNGPDFTLIVGNGPLGDAAVRCAYVGDGARLEGFTLTNGRTRVSGGLNTEQSGGGALCESSAVVSNCVIRANAANSSGGGIALGSVRDCAISGNWAGAGGGAFGGEIENCSIFGNWADSGGGMSESAIRNCTLSGNWAWLFGGGTSGGTVQNCTVVSNSATVAGGVFESTVRNSIVFYNSADSGGANWRNGDVASTCTTPIPPGPGNISSDPQFVDAGVSNLQLQSTSPCIDAGTNEAWMIGATDLGGVQRIVNATVDMGAYESLSPVITDIASSSNGMIITWHSVSNMDYAVYGASNLVDGLDLLQDQIPATPPFNVYTDAVVGVESRSYGMEVQP